MHDSSTVFPENIDNRIWWSDIDLTQVPTMNTYQGLLRDKNYTTATNMLKNSSVFYYGSWLINMFRNRLVALHNYMPFVKKSIANIYSMLEPSKPEDNIYIKKNGQMVNTTIWIDSDTLRPKPADMELYIPYYEMIRVEEEEIDDMFDGE